ncbi:MAG: hypothetical protein LC720_02255, partial [Actinobacteria bacterium]|nr:hypothetical protein [Actinomycetota bacterium]
MTIARRRVSPGVIGPNRRRAIGLASVVLLAGCGGSRPPGAPPPATPPARSATPSPAAVSLVARAIHPEVAVFARPGSSRPERLLSSPNQYGVRRVFLVKRTRPGWLDVYLPMRPNGSTGWVRRSSVSVIEDPYRVQIDLRRH